jgi:AraC-like DNA-binding protein
VLANRINKWLKGIQKYLFFYRDGFFEFYYLSNSPQIMIESLIKMPVTKHNKQEQAIYSTNPFMVGVMHYREIEEGLWLIVTDMNFKANVHSRAIYMNEESDYYFLAFTTYKSDVKLENTVINKIAFPSKNWSLFRPGTEIDAFHYKGTKGLFFNFAFSKSWAEKNLSLSRLYEENKIKKFLESDTGFICWEDFFPESEILAMEIWEIVRKQNDGHFNSLTLKIHTLKIITEFFKTTITRKLPENYLPLSEADRRGVTHAEKILKDHLTTVFPGIDSIAKQVHMSSTKLKSNFKSFYGVSLLQYYNQNKMILAMQLIKETNISVKGIASSTGYESAGKFSAAFRKQYGILPTQVKKG